MELEEKFKLLVRLGATLIKSQPVLRNSHRVKVEEIYQIVNHNLEIKLIGFPQNIDQVG